MDEQKFNSSTENTATVSKQKNKKDGKRLFQILICRLKSYKRKKNF